jgi:preprotein translocase subunit SecG
MQTVLIVVHLMVVVALVGVVLLQRSEGGALGVGGGGGFLTGRGQANALTRATAVLAALFFATSLALTILASLNRAPRSILESAPIGEPGQSPANQNGGNLLDELKRQEEQKKPQPGETPAPAPVAPAVPEAPKP